MKKIIMAAMIVSLAACGGDKDDVATEQQQDWESRNQSLVYSFPDNGQEQVPVPSPVVLRFSSPVMATSPAIVLREVGGQVVSDVALEWVDGKRGLIITPDSKLKPLTEYLVQIPAIELEKGEAPARNLRFTTRALFEGPKSLVAAETFEVTRMIPDGENYQVMDFSSFRVQFSQPLEQTTVKYGDSADSTVQLMGPEGLVDAHLLVSGRYMTIDPKEDLTPGAEYSLNMTTGVTSTYGETLPGGSFGNPGDTLAVSVKVSPQDTKAPGTGLRVSMVQDVADTGELSPLTGQPINLVPMASVLLGEDTATQASGTIAAELAFVPNFPDATPFRVKRGALIEGASIEVLIGGEVPAGFESGKVRMDFLSDATGYLLPNPYSDSDDAPRQVRLFMDVAVSTETPSANGAITQDLLHIELVGTSIVEDGRMVINAVGVVEPDVLGSERAKGILSFYMKAYEDQDSVPSLNVDTTPINIQSWSPGVGTRAGLYSPGDPIVINFNKTIGNNLPEGSVLLEKNGESIDVDYYSDGASLVINPSEDIKMSEENDRYVYRLRVNGVYDIMGGYSQLDFDETFELPLVIQNKQVIESGLPVRNELSVHAPTILSLYPGFPCVYEPSTTDIGNSIAGRCVGGFPGVDEGNERDIKSADDLIPVMTIPRYRSIHVSFHKDIDPQSIVLGGSFKVEEIDAEGNVLNEVKGNLKKYKRRISFTPDTPWKEGGLYRYVLGSGGYSITEEGHQLKLTSNQNYSCDGSDAICDLDGYPLHTLILGVGKIVEFPSGNYQTKVVGKAAPDIHAGGPDMIQYFSVSETKEETVLQFLAGAPNADSNNNFYHDKTTDINLKGMRYVFDENEKGPTSIMDEFSDPQFDPDGVVGYPNSSKILIVPRDDSYDVDNGKLISSINVGCGHMREDDTGLFDFDNPQRHVCPEDKFLYLHTSLYSEVTNEIDSTGRLKVLIWPAVLITTSIDINSMLSLASTLPDFEDQFALDQRGFTAKQIMRMRFIDADDDGKRNDPIEGWIEFSGDEPILTADVDIYLDAPSMVDYGGFGSSNGSTNLNSFEISMRLSGPVEFLDDGRMVVKQLNTEEIKFPVYVLNAGNNNLVIQDVVIPKNGTFIQYISESIK